MEAVLPVYEDGTGGAFYNRCVVEAVESLVSLLHSTDADGRAHSKQRGLVVYEIGAGTGGTASSVLPVLDGHCEKYVFTDVSEVFLRQAKRRFGQYSFVEYSLLNIDADPRRQGELRDTTYSSCVTCVFSPLSFCDRFAITTGFPSQQADILISTNCLHATPFMRNTLRHCRQLLKPTGMIVVNEAMYTSPFLQITFGLTDGWWLFAESGDPERVEQDSPLLCWRQWQSLLTNSGFRHMECIQGKSFLEGQAVIVAQASTPTIRKLSQPSGRDLGSGRRSLHFFSGGLGGLGLLAARQLFETTDDIILLTSRSDRVVAGSEGDWAWLAACSRPSRR